MADGRELRQPSSRWLWLGMATVIENKPDAQLRRLIDLAIAGNEVLIDKDGYVFELELVLYPPLPEPAAEQGQNDAG
jgi:hypothetical protein